MEQLVALTRCNRIESIHKGYICITDIRKNINYSIGNPNTKIYLRSSAKPIQAVAFVDSGAMNKFDITLKELATICSSHSGEDFHREAVNSILYKAGLSIKDLNCGVANPYNSDTLNELVKKGERPSQLYNCCSGKHAGMLALCKHNNFPIEGYVEPEHPVQQLILKTISELLECRTEDITIGIDGCGTPTFMMSLNQAAYLYALLALGSNGTGKYNKAFGLIQKAMISYPRMINGDREFCTDLITHTNGKVIGKVGAEGTYCAAIPEKQIGICIKILDGNERSVYPVIIHILKQLGVLSNQEVEHLKAWAYPLVKNHKGKIVGYTVPIFDIYKEYSDMQLGDNLEVKGVDI